MHRCSTSKGGEEEEEIGEEWKEEMRDVAREERYFYKLD
jgi:hypothetical protein